MSTAPTGRLLSFVSVRSDPDVSTTIDCGPSVILLPLRRAGAGAGEAARSWLSSSTRHVRSIPSIVGTTNVNGSHQPLIEHDDVVVDGERAVLAPVGVVVAVDHDGDAAGGRVAPVVVGHDVAGRGEPAEVLRRLGADEEATATEHRMGVAQRDQATGEGEEIVVDVRPVEPGDRVVLAVGVVVAALGAAELVAAEQHRHAERQQQRRQQRPRLGGAQGDHARDRPSGPRPRSSTSGCRRCRRGCPRRWPRCAWCRRRRGRAG